MDQCGCSKCGAPFSDLAELPIPDSARYDLIPAKRATHTRTKPIEPALIICRVCGFQFSSQRLLRSVLLNFRPERWPVWEHALPSNEVEEQVIKELICRDTMKEAVDTIDNRQICRASLRSEHEYGGFASELLHQQGCAQMTLCKSDDDPFPNDELTR